MLNSKSFRSAKNALASIELMHMMRKDQFAIAGAGEVAGQICPA
jgi:transposase-like protein